MITAAEAYERSVAVLPARLQRIHTAVLKASGDGDFHAEFDFELSSGLLLELQRLKYVVEGHRDKLGFRVRWINPRRDT